MTKEQYINKVMKMHKVSRDTAERTVKSIMKAYGYVTDKDGVICGAEFTK